MSSIVGMKGERQCGGAGGAPTITKTKRGNPGYPELPIHVSKLNDADADQKTIGILKMAATRGLRSWAILEVALKGSLCTLKIRAW